MNWIRICVNIADDPAIGAIADACDIPIAEALGCVVAVLCKLPAHAKTGDLSAIADRSLEKWANWEHERGAFATAFRRALCTPDGTVAAWERHNGAAMREADAARERMQEARRNAKANKKSDTPTPSAERSANVRSTVREPFASNGTGRNETPPSSPDGSESLPVQAVPTAANAALPVTTTPPQPASGIFAEWERQLFAAALPHEAAALEHICSQATFRPAVIGELYAIASGQHVVRGEHAPYREANAADVMRAVSEFACKGREWNTSFFRGVVRTILNRPAEPPDAAQREQERLAKAVASRVTVAQAEAPRTAEEIEAGRARREAAMAKFRAEFQANRAGEQRSAELTGVGSIVQTLVA